MDVIKNFFTTTEINFLDKIYNENSHYFNRYNERINIINLFHKDAKDNEEVNSQIFNFFNEINVYENKLNLGIIALLNAPPNCKNQGFHIDYQGNTDTYLISTSEISDKNGTEYLNFIDESNYLKHLKEFIRISYKYDNKEDIVSHLTNNTNLVFNKDYSFKIVNCPKYSIIKLPHFVFHRGKTNETNENRVLFNITYFRKDIKMNSNKIIEDAEIDEYDSQLCKFITREIFEEKKKNDGYIFS